MKTITDQFNVIVAGQELKEKSWVDRNQPYIQAAFNLAGLFLANSLTIAVWRSLTGH